MKRIVEQTDKLIHDLRQLKDKPHPVVLIVEDDEHDAYLASLAAKSAGCLVELAGTGEEAMKWINSSVGPSQPNIDIMFLDLKLPGMSGVEVLRQVRATLPNLPVIVITSPLYQEMIQEAGKLGYFGIVEKPLTNSDVKEVLTKHGIANPKRYSN